MLLDTQALCTEKIHIGGVGFHSVFQNNLDAVGTFPPNQQPHLLVARRKSLSKEIPSTLVFSRAHGSFLLLQVWNDVPQ